MSTANRIETNRAGVNRANAQHSTGPKTPEGKQTSSQNALKHGLTAQNPVLPTDDLDDYQRHVATFFAEYSPQGATEANLVQSIADASWRLNRVADVEAGLIHDSARYIEILTKALSNLSMHSTRLSRQFERAVTQLRELQKARRDRENQETKAEPIEFANSGFVFSDAEIPAHIHARTRDSLATEAGSRPLVPHASIQPGRPA